MSSTPIPGASTWNPLQHLSQTSEKRWAELSRPEFPDYTRPADDERTKFESKNYDRKDDPTNRMYTAPASFCAPSAPFRRTVTFKSSTEIDNDLALVEASMMMSKLPALPKNVASICPLEEIIGTDGDGYVVGLVNASTSKRVTDANVVDETYCAASENLLSLTSVDVANAIAAIAPIFGEYYQTFVRHHCDGNMIAHMTEGGVDAIVATLSSWEIMSSIHRTRIAQIFNEWRANPPKPAAARKSHHIKVLPEADTYSMTMKKAGTLASEIPDTVKATSLKIDQHFSHFKKLNLMPLKITSGLFGASSITNIMEKSNVFKRGSENGASDPVQSDLPTDLSVKYPIPRDKLLAKIFVVGEKDVSESEVLANRLTSSQVSSDFEKTSATIRHFIESPLFCDELGTQVGTVHQIDSDSIKASSQPTSKLKTPQVVSYDASPNIYSRPSLPVSRYTDTSDVNLVSLKNVLTLGKREAANEHASIWSVEAENTTEPNIVQVPVDESTLQASHLSQSFDSRKMQQKNSKHDLSPEKTLQNFPTTGEVIARVLTPKSKTEGRFHLDRPSSATHRVAWVDEADKEENQMQASLEDAGSPGAEKIEADRVLEAMRCKTPLTIYLNAADKNFRPTKSKYNAGLQLLPLRQPTDGPDGKFDSKQRSVGLRFGERAANVSATGVSASGVQFNPVSALFRSKRWKVCSNYPLFTSQLKASKDLQRFARLAITPHFQVDFRDERSMTRCIESSKLFALHFVLASKYDDFGQQQFEPAVEEHDSVAGFFWTGLAE